MAQTDHERALRYYGKDNSPNFYFEFMARFYENRVLRPLVEQGKIGFPNNVFIGGCGYGRDILAAGMVFPDAKITAVSVGQTPIDEVRAVLGNRLEFHEASIHGYLFERSFREKLYDLALFFNVLSPDLNYGVLSLLTPHMASGSHILETDDSSEYLNFTTLPYYGFQEESLPHQVQQALLRGSLWKKVRD